MILAAARYAQAEAEGQKAEAPRELVWHWNLQAYGLPHAGGWMDQPAGLLDQMRQAGWVYESFRSRAKVKAGELAKWKQTNPGMARTVKQVEKLLEKECRLKS